MDDVFVFLKMWYFLLGGYMLYQLIDIGETPYRNNQVEENNHILSKLDIRYMEAKFIPGVGCGADDDGYFEWKQPMAFNRVTSTDFDTEEIILLPARFPLEVGTTSAETTHFHLAQCGGVVRWPYEYKLTSGFYIVY